MTTVRRRSLSDRLEGATACGDLETLAQRIFAAVAAEVPFAFACLATTDPASELITRAFKSHPLPINDEGFAAVEYGEPDLNQFAELTRRPVPVGALSIDTEGQPQLCRRMREYMTPRFGFTDELRVVCRARSTTWAVLGLYRAADEPAFTRRETEVLAGVHGLIASAVQRTLFASNGANAQAADDAAVLVVDPEDRVTDMSAAARERLTDLGPWQDGTVPTSVLAAAAQARASSQAVATRVLSRSGRWFALRALALDGSTAARSVVVTIDPAPAAVIGQMTLAARGLTTREQDVAHLVLQGVSTKTIAATLHLSPHTVQDHLKSIFRKLDVTSRREMIAQLVLK